MSGKNYRPHTKQHSYYTNKIYVAIWETFESEGASDTKEKYTSSPSAGIFTQTVDFEFGKYRICLFCTDELILETVILQCFMLQSKSHNKKCQI